MIEYSIKHCFVNYLGTPITLQVELQANFITRRLFSLLHHVMHRFLLGVNTLIFPDSILNKIAIEINLFFTILCRRLKWMSFKDLLSI